MSLIIRCSQLGKIMTDGKKGEELSAGAKTYLRELLKKEILGYDDEISSKYLEKGIRCEEESLNLYNQVFFTDYTKNTERRTDDYITGEADILADGLVIDLKTSWSLNTFPLFACDAVNNDYEWQLRGYMRLFDLPRAELAYCMVSTPIDLCQYEDRRIHEVDHIPPELRVRVLKFERDADKEAAIVAKVEAARRFYDALREDWIEGKA